MARWVSRPPARSSPRADKSDCSANTSEMRGGPWPSPRSGRRPGRPVTWLSGAAPSQPNPERCRNVGDIFVAAPAQTDQDDCVGRKASSAAPDPGERVGRFQRRDDPFEAGELLKCIERLGVGRSLVADSAGISEVAMLGANAGVIESRGDRVRRGHLAVGVLQQVTQASVKHPWRACAQRGAMMTGGDALSRSLDSDQPDLTIVEE